MAIWKRCILLGLLLILGQLLVTWAIGLPSAPMLSPDSGFYLDGARRFPQLLARQRPYLGMILYLKFCGVIGLAPWLAVAGNAAAVWLASLALWQIATHWAGPRAGWVAAGIWLLNPLTAQWSRYVLTEPLFYSAVISWLWLALFRPGWPLLIFSGIAASLRPNAFTLLAAAITWLFALRVRPCSRAALLIALGWAALLAALLFVAPLVTPVAMKVPQLMAQGTVIHSHPALDVRMGSSPFAILRLMVLRLAWELGQWRPWYSLRFNLFIIVSMVAFYASSLRGAWLTRGTRLFWAVVVVSVPSMAVIAATWAIHEGRFGWWFLVAWIPWAAIGCQQSNRLALR